MIEIWHSRGRPFLNLRGCGQLGSNRLVLPPSGSVQDPRTQPAANQEESRRPVTQPLLGRELELSLCRPSQPGLLSWVRRRKLSSERCGERAGVTGQCVGATLMCTPRHTGTREHTTCVQANGCVCVRVQDDTLHTNSVYNSVVTHCAQRQGTQARRHRHPHTHCIRACANSHGGCASRRQSAHLAIWSRASSRPSDPASISFLPPPLPPFLPPPRCLLWLPPTGQMCLTPQQPRAQGPPDGLPCL